MRIAYLALETEKRKLLKFAARLDCENFKRVITKSITAGQFDKPDCALEDLALQFAEWCEGEVTIVTGHPRWLDFMPPNFFTYNKLGNEWGYITDPMQPRSLQDALNLSEMMMFRSPVTWREYV